MLRLREDYSVHIYTIKERTRTAHGLFYTLVKAKDPENHTLHVKRDVPLIKSNNRGPPKGSKFYRGLTSSQGFRDLLENVKFYRYFEGGGLLCQLNGILALSVLGSTTLPHSLSSWHFCWSFDKSSRPTVRHSPAKICPGLCHLSSYSTK